MSDSVPRKDPADGLQAERTWLSWSRTSFGVLGNGALLMARDAEKFTGPLWLLPIMLAAAVALLTYFVGLHRQRVLRRHRLPSPLAAGTEIRIVGVAVLLLIVVTAGVLVL